MRLFLVGACGRLGRAVVREAAEQEIDVVGLDRVPWPDSETKPGSFTLYSGSLEDLSLIEPLLDGCDGIINTAGMHGGHVAAHDLAAFLDANVTAVARLLDRALQRRVRRVALSSTMEIIIGREWLSSGMAVVDEDSPPRIDSIYSQSKHLMEELGKTYAKEHGVSIASLRYMAFGYGDDCRLGPGLLARSVATRDVARACILAATRDDLRGEVIHIGPKTPLTNADIVAAMYHPENVIEKYYAGATAILHRSGAKLKTSSFWPVTSIRKAKQLLDWEPKYTFEQWLIENGWDPSTPRAAAAVLSGGIV